MSGGDDTIPKFYKINEEEAELIHKYEIHSQPIKNVDHNDEDLYLSCDGHLIAVCHLNKKQIIRTLYNDQLQPHKTLLQAAQYLSSKNSFDHQAKS